MVNQCPTGCLTAFSVSPFEVRDDSNPAGNGLSHLNQINLGGAATPSPAARQAPESFPSRVLHTLSLCNYLSTFTCAFKLIGIV